MKLATITEGRTRLMVPEESLASVPPTNPVFFNPAAAFNRDVSVLHVAAAEGLTFCDALAGVGARGIRIAKEVSRGLQIALVDFNRASLELARQSAKENRVASRCDFKQSETNAYLYGRYGSKEKYDFVDVDPFGTPVPYLQAALRATRDEGTTSFTATDTAVLCGVHPEVAIRRYGGLPLNNHFHHETGVRLLVNAIRREGASLDLRVLPTLVHSTRHYIRVYVRVEEGAAKTEKGSSEEGFVVWCRNCGYLCKETVPCDKCPNCGSKPKSAGPLWMGRLTDRILAQKAHAEAEKRGLRQAKKLLAGLIQMDAFPPWSFSIERICSSLGIATAPHAKVLAELQGRGFKCGPQPLETTGLKTDASYSDVEAAVKAAGAHPSQ